MPVEIEAKMKVESPEGVVAALQRLSAHFVSETFEVNTFYDTEDRGLLAADQGLRLRVATNTATGQVACVLTHKGPNQTGPLKRREETELHVESAQEAERFIQRLGFSRMMSFQKKRKSWKLESCSVEIDEVPLLGLFVEIEGPTDAAVMHVRQILGLAERPLIKASYIGMLSSHLQEKGDRRKDVCFAPQV